MATQLRLAEATRPAVAWPASSPFRRSARVWLALLAYLGLVELFITLIGAGLEHDPRSVLFSWPSLAIFGAAGLVGIWFSHRTGFPVAWDAHASRQRWLDPALLGLGFGLLAIVLDQLTHGIPFFLEQTGLTQFNAPFPGSLLFYPGGAILVEVLYRLLPIPLLLWLISSVGRGLGSGMRDLGARPHDAGHPGLQQGVAEDASMGRRPGRDPGQPQARTLARPVTEVRPSRRPHHCRVQTGRLPRRARPTPT